LVLIGCVARLLVAAVVAGLALGGRGFLRGWRAAERSGSGDLGHSAGPTFAHQYAKKPPCQRRVMS